MKKVLLFLAFLLPSFCFAATSDVRLAGGPYAADAGVVTITFNSTDASNLQDPANIGAYAVTVWNASIYTNPGNKSDPNYEIWNVTSKVNSTKYVVTRAYSGSALKYHQVDSGHKLKIRVTTGVATHTATATFTSTATATSTPTATNTPTFTATPTPTFAGFTLLSTSGAPVTGAADTAENTLASVVVPGYTLNANGMLRINTSWRHTNGADDKILRVRFSGIAGTQYLTLTQTTSASTHVQTLIQNRNSLSSQVGGAPATQGGVYETSASAIPTSALDTSGPQTIFITGQKETGGDELVLERYTVERLNP